MSKHAYVIMAMCAGFMATTTLGVVATGCSSEAEAPPIPPGPEGGADAASDARSLDGTVPPDVSAEAASDTGNGTDTGGEDTGTDAPGMDALAETGADGGGPDAGPDAGPDGAPQDGGEGGSPIDAVADVNLSGFQAAVTSTWCQHLAACCGLADSGTFDMASCLQGPGNYHISADLAPITTISRDSGTITFDQTSASRCLNGIAAIPCDTLTSSTLLTIRSDCFGAVQGTIPVGGAGCTKSVECAPQGFCQPATDGGPGSCLAILAQDAGCTSDEQCSYRKTGQPAQYCDVWYQDAGGTRVCVPQKAVGGSCVDIDDYNFECTTDICVTSGATPVCGSSNPFSDPGVAGGVCETFTIVDAGGGG
jgi:hypothetical protein